MIFSYSLQRRTSVCRRTVGRGQGIPRTSSRVLREQPMLDFWSRRVPVYSGGSRSNENCSPTRVSLETAGYRASTCASSTSRKLLRILYSRKSGGGSLRSESSSEHRRKTLATPAVAKLRHLLSFWRSRTPPVVIPSICACSIRGNKRLVLISHQGKWLQQFYRQIVARLGIACSHGAMRDRIVPTLKLAYSINEASDLVPVSRRTLRRDIPQRQGESRPLGQARHDPTERAAAHRGRRDGAQSVKEKRECEQPTLHASTEQPARSVAASPLAGRVAGGPLLVSVHGRVPEAGSRWECAG